MLCIGELTSGSHPVLARDIHVGINKKKILFILRTSKTHWKDSKPQLVKLSNCKNKIKEDYCPFRILQDFAQQRNPCRNIINEPFFIFRDYSPVTPSHLTQVLQMALKLNNIDPYYYSCHCFHAGRASNLLKMGISVETIKKLGRWKSNAVYNYLR